MVYSHLVQRSATWRARPRAGRTARQAEARLPSLTRRSPGYPDRVHGCAMEVVEVGVNACTPATFREAAAPRDLYRSLIFGRQLFLWMVHATLGIPLSTAREAQIPRVAW